MSSHQHRPEQVTVVSFRGVFRAERRLHHVGDIRVPTPYGIPYTGIGWFIAALIIVILLGQLPVIGAGLGFVPLPIRFVIVPGAVAWGMLRIRPDGREAHRMVSSIARHQFTAKRVAGFQRAETPGSEARLTDIELSPDTTTGRRVRISAKPSAHKLRLGRANTLRVLVAYPTRMRGKGTDLHVAVTSNAPLTRRVQIELRPGQTLHFEGTDH